jgi:hypothetical protein
VELQQLSWKFNSTARFGGPYFFVQYVPIKLQTAQQTAAETSLEIERARLQSMIVIY